jgi:hypothetical protein
MQSRRVLRDRRVSKYRSHRHTATAMNLSVVNDNWGLNYTRRNHAKSSSREGTCDDAALAPELRDEGGCKAGLINRHVRSLIYSRTVRDTSRTKSETSDVRMIHKIVPSSACRSATDRTVLAWQQSSSGACGLPGPVRVPFLHAVARPQKGWTQEPRPQV